MRALALTLTLTLALPLPAAAQEVIGSYTAYIGQDDLYNSQGARLTRHWQVLRQDRANYHRFGIAQQGDEWDPFFGDVDNRAAMEQMLLSGHITSEASRAILGGGVFVTVYVYGSGGRGGYIEVDVFR